MKNQQKLERELSVLEEDLRRTGARLGQIRRNKL